jgi:hypothetical protein
MPTKTNEEREALLDECMELYIMGCNTPYRLIKNCKGVKSFDAAKSYIGIIENRLRDAMERQHDIPFLVFKQLKEVEKAKYNAFRDWQLAISQNNVTAANGALSTLATFLQREAKLKGLDAKEPLGFIGTIQTKEDPITEEDIANIKKALELS